MVDLPHQLILFAGTCCDLGFQTRLLIRWRRQRAEYLAAEKAGQMPCLSKERANGLERSLRAPYVQRGPGHLYCVDKMCHSAGDDKCREEDHEPRIRQVVQSCLSELLSYNWDGKIRKAIAKSPRTTSRPNADIDPQPPNMFAKNMSPAVAHDSAASTPARPFGSKRDGSFYCSHF